MMYKYLLIFVVLIILIFPLQALAQERGFLGGPIVPCGVKSDSSRSDSCTFCHIFVLARNIINFLFEIILVIAPAFLIVGGLMVLLSAGNPGRIDLGKRIITSTVIGIVIAVVSWMALGTLFNQFIDDSVMPWPWNAPDCEGGGVAQFTYCHHQASDGTSALFDNYETSARCQNECSRTCSTSGCDAWCCLREDRSGQIDACGQTNPANGEYCVCEIPRYNLLSVDDLSSTFGQIYTDIRVTDLDTIENCRAECTPLNSDFMQYCDQDIRSYPADRYDLYCESASQVNSIPTCRVQLTSIDNGCRVGTTCYNSDSECLNAAETTFRNKCFLDGRDFCESHSHGFSTYCPTGSQKALCGSRSDQYVLYQWHQEQGVNPADRPGTYSAYECSRDAYANTGYYCRLDCSYNRCTGGTDGDRCDQLSEPGPCFGGVFTCKRGVLDQVRDACDELDVLINCLGTKIPAETRFISSISDNSRSSTHDPLPDCFETWTSICSVGQDSCSGTCCGHNECSLHYGGRANINWGPSDSCGTGTINCRRCSWAVDLGRESVQYYLSRGYTSSQIEEIYRDFAQECVSENAVLRLGGGGLQLYNEGNHIHIGLSGVAGYVNYRCIR